MYAVITAVQFRRQYLPKNNRKNPQQSWCRWETLVIPEPKRVSRKRSAAASLRSVSRLTEAVTAGRAVGRQQKKRRRYWRRDRERALSKCVSAISQHSSGTQPTGTVGSARKEWMTTVIERITITTILLTMSFGQTDCGSDKNKNQCNSNSNETKNNRNELRDAGRKTEWLKIGRYHRETVYAHSTPPPSVHLTPQCRRATLPPWASVIGRASQQLRPRRAHGRKRSASRPDRGFAFPAAATYSYSYWTNGVHLHIF